MRSPRREECILCDSPNPDWDELCQMCWEDYTVFTWGQAVRGERLFMVDEWVAKKRLDAFHARQKELFNADQLIVPLIG